MQPYGPNQRRHQGCRCHASCVLSLAMTWSAAAAARFITAVSDAQALIARHSEGPVELNQASGMRYTPWQPQPEPVSLSTHLRPGAPMCRT